MEPRATKAEVEAVLKPLARKVSRRKTLDRVFPGWAVRLPFLSFLPPFLSLLQPFEPSPNLSPPPSINTQAAKKVLEAYDGLVPINPCVLSHMLSVGMAITVLPDLGLAAASSSSSSSSPSSSSGDSDGPMLRKALLPAVAAAAGPGGGCLSAARAAAQPHELARVRRDLDCQVRDGDQARQKVLNEVTFLCAMRLPALGPVQSASDLDLLFPKSRIVLRVSAPSSHEEPPAFSFEEGVGALRSLVISHFRPGAGGHSESCRGVEQAALRGARQGGWRTATLDGDKWRASKSEADKLAMLREVLGH